MAKISLFDPENSFWSFLMRIYNLAYAGFLWFVTSLPLFTIGASTTALYTYAFSVVEQRDGYVSRTFFASFRKHFVKATLIWLGVVALFAFLYIDAYLLSTRPTLLYRMLFFLLIGIALIVVVVAVHIFPLLSQGDLPYTQLGSRVILLGIGSLPLSITLVVIHALFFLLIYAFPPAILCLHGFVAALCALFLKSAYEKHTSMDTY